MLDRIRPYLPIILLGAGAFLVGFLAFGRKNAGVSAPSNSQQPNGTTNAPPIQYIPTSGDTYMNYTQNTTNDTTTTTTNNNPPPPPAHPQPGGPPQIMCPAGYHKIVDANGKQTCVPDVPAGPPAPPPPTPAPTPTPTPAPPPPPPQPVSTTPAPIVATSSLPWWSWFWQDYVSFRQAHGINPGTEPTQIPMGGDIWGAYENWSSNRFAPAH